MTGDSQEKLAKMPTAVPRNRVTLSRIQEPSEIPQMVPHCIADRKRRDANGIFLASRGQSTQLRRRDSASIVAKCALCTTCFAGFADQNPVGATWYDRLRSRNRHTSRTINAAFSRINGRSGRDFRAAMANNLHTSNRCRVRLGLQVGLSWISHSPK